MKKIIIILLFLNFSIRSVYGQSVNIEGVQSISAPSAGSIKNTVNTPVSYSTGIPNINISFFSLPTYNKEISINGGMAYHPGNAGISGNGTDVGLGWSLYGMSGYIYRQINGNEPDSELTGGDDTYYYNFLGRSGKFFLRSPAAGQTPLIEKITVDKLQISYINALGVLKFTIVDERGNTFFFDIADKSYSESLNAEFSNVYYLSKIVDANSVEILNYEYLEDNYTMTIINYPYSKPIKSLKLQKINSPGFGSISFTYDHNILFRKSYTDPFRLSFIELKNTQNRTIEKYGFEQEQTGFSYPYVDSGAPDPCNHRLEQEKRMLKRLIRYNSLNQSEITKFTYRSENFDFYWAEPYDGCFPNEIDNPKYLGKGLLEKIEYPTGGETRYEYEPNQYYVNKNTQAYLDEYAPPYVVRDRDAQYYEYLTTVYFDTHNGNLFHFQIPNDATDHYLYFSQNIDTYYSPCEAPDSPYQCDATPFINVSYPQGTPVADGQKYTSGRKTITISGTGGSGSVTVHRIKYKTNPIQNFTTGEGVRIKSITYYENGNKVDGLTKNYYYGTFDGGNITSGSYSIAYEPVVYKNVKEVIGNENGYTKYYFKTMEDYPENLTNEGKLNAGDLKYYNILSSGLLDKTEVYNESNNIVSSESNGYEFYDLPGYMTLPNSMTIRNSIIKKHITTSNVSTSTGNITQIKEIVRNTKDYNIISRKTTEFDGTVNEQNITYPWNYVFIDPRLWNAGITSIPLVVETKRNGTTVSKSETKYENTSHFYPTSQISYLPDTLSQSIKNVSYDMYDDKGNPVQYTVFPEAGSTGVPTTIIYGYNKTLPIAKIEGAKFSDIPTALITAIVNASNEDANATSGQEEAKELALIDALNTFKNDSSLQNFMVTCYTYNSLIGLTATIPPNGIMELYKYDSYNRLLKTVDVNGNTIKEYQYNYKQ